jgi:hypothetical protein
MQPAVGFPLAHFVIEHPWVVALYRLATPFMPTGVFTYGVAVLIGQMTQ